MLDIRRIRSELDLVKKAIARRGEDTSMLDDAFDLDRRQRELADQRDRLRNEIVRGGFGRLRRLATQ